ncbi:manganese-dependent ADP-ribose/CDP-alcohol diphosphatase-like [Patiria miniata]|uniref:Calcineurin-like phosphoesterase domain-containing protein n=1 Tax=Patiria miniata TaxID=46514 RepID=A0A914ALK1_PATMI|nr:manganese-dependent ADP-ribose/CDP-alcohol diphosphatase-like [Patiria miniata]
MEDTASACLFSFGVISDIQYADIDNRLNSTKTHTRYYRNAVALLTKAIDYWNSDVSAMRPDFVMQLGDIIDGFNNEGGKSQSLRSLRVILNQFDRLPCTVHHALGNHEFYNFNRVEIMNSRLFSGVQFETTPRDSKCECFPDLIQPNEFSAEGLASYYHFSPAPGFRFVVLDTFNESIIGHVEKCPINQQSLHRVRTVNKNDDLESPAGLKVSEKRFLAYNGGLGEKQLEWLEDVLQGACSTKEKVILFGHVSIYPVNGDHTCLLWDYPKVDKMLRAFPCVVAAFAGHTHNYAHTIDASSGIHFVTLPGIVEVPPGSNGFGTILVYADKLVLHGVGQMGSLEMIFA